MGRQQLSPKEINRDLAILQLLKHETASIITNVLRKCRLELIDLNTTNYISKCYVLASQIDHYLEYLERLQERIGIGAEQLEAERRRWEGLQEKIRNIKPEEIGAFKIEMGKLFSDMSLRLSMFNASIDDQMNAVRAKVA